MPAHKRVFFASSACAANLAASPGKKWLSTVAAAAEIVEWPDVNDGKGGVGISTFRVGSAVIGRAVQ